MSAQTTLQNLSDYCFKDSTDPTTWNGKNSTYRWTVGKEAANGEQNGVVRKLAGIDVSGKQIWVVAGSFKINKFGTILRFTGLPKKLQKTLESQAVSNPIVSPQLVTV